MDLRAIWVCQCGCGGMMLSFDGENFYAHHFSFDFYTHQNKAKDFAAARAQYLKGDPTIAEIVINREDIDDLREFLENVKMSGGLKPYAERAASELKVVHLLGDLYAVWLEGKLPQTEVLKGNFYKMFECRLSPEDVDRLLYEIDRCVRLQELHEMPQGDSQHLRKFSKKLDKKTKKQESENASLNTVTDTAGEDEVESARGSAGGIFQLQMNVVDSKTLIAAKEDPTLFPNLVVRVWGFSAYFNDLPEEYKNVLIARAIESEKAA